MAAAEHINRPHRVRAESKRFELLKRVAASLVRGVLYILICVIFLVPLAWMFFGSLRREREIFGYLTRSAGARFSRSSGRLITTGTSWA